MKRPNKRILVVGAIAIAALCVLFSLPSRKHDSIVQGRRVSAWILQLGSAQSVGEYKIAAEALRASGTNAIPMLLEMIESKDSKFIMGVTKVMYKLPIRSFDIVTSYQKHYAASLAIKEIGANAKVPMDRLNSFLFADDPGGFFTALSDLSAVGPGAIPLLARAYHRVAAGRGGSIGGTIRHIIEEEPIASAAQLDRLKEDEDVKVRELVTNILNSPNLF